MKNASKLMAVVLSIVVVLAFSVNAFAATYSTATSYTLTGISGGTTNAVQVKTTVAGLTTDDEVAYLVTNDGGIVYLEQNTVVGTSTEFNFSADAQDIYSDSASIKVGSMKGGAAVTPDAGANIVTVDAYQVSYDSTAGGTVTATTADNNLSDGKTIKGGSVTFTITADSGYELTEVTVGGTPLETLPGATYTLENVAADTAVYFTFSTTVVPVDLEVAAASLDVGNNEAEPAKSYVASYATITGAATEGVDYKSLEYGVLYTKDAAKLVDLTVAGTVLVAGASANDYDNGVIRFPAQMANEMGQYIVQLIDGGSNALTTEGYTVVPYVLITMEDDSQVLKIPSL